jgi:hypothetical protein
METVADPSHEGDGVKIGKIHRKNLIMQMKQLTPFTEQCGHQEGQCEEPDESHHGTHLPQKEENDYQLF